MQFPEVATLSGFITPAGPGQAFRPWSTRARGSSWRRCSAMRSTGAACLCAPGDLTAAARATWRSAAPASVGIIATVGLSTLMEHSGMTQLLAQGLAALMGAGFPLVSPLVGMLGAFATGSNNNSNVLFAPLQKSIAALLAHRPAPAAGRPDRRRRAGQHDRPGQDHRWLQHGRVERPRRRCAAPHPVLWAGNWPAVGRVGDPVCQVIQSGQYGTRIRLTKFSRFVSTAAIRSSMKPLRSKIRTG